MASQPTDAGSSRDDTDSYLGLSAEAAGERARTQGWSTVRSLPPDAIITMEFLEGRLNFAVRDDVVVRCWAG
ncbi:proteinase inhibitor I78 [Streptomyces sp. SM12]|uniref:proteinase inhibitor I78 n=1 Tax=Streptomyces sp. SM12 TaxID=1071602 RepID=UPI000CD587B5|nr:proteinase inhibitor I78 [Streptomyces sp. SM12]